MSEQRTKTRQRVLKAGTISLKNGAGINCVVRNISADGAALEVESQAGIPSEFNLVIGTEQFSEICRVLWRKTKRLGVEFQPRRPVALDPSLGILADPSAACIRSYDMLPEHPGPPLAPDFPG
jgi:PilZ domain